MKDLDLERRIPTPGKFRIANYEFAHKGTIGCDVLGEYLVYTELTHEDIARIDKFVLACLEPESRDLWTEARDKDNPNPLTTFDIKAVADYLLEATMGRPTDSSSASGGTRPSITTTSTEGSLSEAVA